MDITEKARALAEKELCDHCLGRQFARLGYGLENYERGQIVREALDDGREITEDDFDSEAVPDDDPVRSDDCEICEGLFVDFDDHVEMVYNALERYEFETYLVGTRPPADVVEAEEGLWEEVGLQWVEPIKSEINRLVGKGLEQRLSERRDMDVDVDFGRADVNPILDFEQDTVEMDINSLLVHGFYNKLERGIPQTKWPCSNCRGSGCDDCDWTGKQYPTSVQEIIAEPFIRETRALETKFHGAGREDVDARCLGKREFVLEMIEPMERDIDVQELQDEINDDGRVEVFGLEQCQKSLVEDVKSRRSEKTYRAVVELGEAVTTDQLEELDRLLGTVQQETPERVEHRRAEKTRERDVHSLEWEQEDDTHIILTIRGDAGLYIKELISGDGDRTDPSVSGVLGVEAVCTELDVVAIEKPEGYEDV